MQTSNEFWIFNLSKLKYDFYIRCFEGKEKAICHITKKISNFIF